MGRLFGEFTTGQRFETPGRTITETDIVAFAGLTGDYNPVHTDEVFAADTEFGLRNNHGNDGRCDRAPQAEAVFRSSQASRRERTSLSLG
jgi:hypothetical protein